FLDAGANLVSVGALDPDATRGLTSATGTLLVGRTERLPFPTRVFFSLGGTATAPLFQNNPLAWDYTLSGMTFPIGGAPFVDIPAGQSYVFVTLTARNN